MTPTQNENPRKHEVAFCADVSKWADRLFEERPTLPFGSSDIESFGRGSNKRRICERHGKEGMKWLAVELRPKPNAAVSDLR